MGMITNYIEYIKEVKNYQLFHGVDSLLQILKSGVVIGTNHWDSPMKRNLLGGTFDTMSCTRNFNAAFKYGEAVIEWDLPKLSSRYQVIPFCENPDFYTDKVKNPKFGGKGSFGKSPKNNTALFSKNKKDNEAYWKVKTDPRDFDYVI